MPVAGLFQFQNMNATQTKPKSKTDIIIMYGRSISKVESVSTKRKLKIDKTRAAHKQPIE